MSNENQINMIIKTGVLCKDYWQMWVPQIPYVPISGRWAVKPLPPFGGAVARFMVKEKDRLDLNDCVSVYLDCYSILGVFDIDNSPYWEIEPHNNSGPSRYEMDDVEGLVRGIGEGLKFIREGQ